MNENSSRGKQGWRRTPFPKVIDLLGAGLALTDVR